jgi:hypothetical protein
LFFAFQPIESPFKKKNATRPEQNNKIEYTKNGALNEMTDNKPPMAGPAIPPTINEPSYTD